MSNVAAETDIVHLKAAAQGSTPATEARLPPLGFIAIECFFTRPSGDPFNQKTWQFPILHELAIGTAESQVVTSQDYDDNFLDRFVAAGQVLADRGCVGLITSCGFLALAQSRLAARLPIPIATSALVQIPSIMAIMPPTQKLGVLTYDAQRLHKGHLEAAGIHPTALERIHIAGAPVGGHLHRLVQQNALYEHEKIESELVDTAKQLLREHPNVSVLVLECTQMPPFAEAIHKSLDGKVQVYDVCSMVNWFYGGLVRSTPSHWQGPETPKLGSCIPVTLGSGS